MLLACAPAGYGKTTMLADWTDQQRAAGVPVAWVTCDRDDDGTAFWSAVILAATEAAPDSATVLAGLDAPAGAGRLHLRREPDRTCSATRCPG